jgi:hypothetical protein
LPVLRRAHGDHRNVRGGIYATASADTIGDRHQDIGGSIVPLEVKPAPQHESR